MARPNERILRYKWSALPIKPSRAPGISSSPEGVRSASIAVLLSFERNVTLWFDRSTITAPIPIFSALMRTGSNLFNSGRDIRVMWEGRRERGVVVFCVSIFEWLILFFLFFFFVG